MRKCFVLFLLEIISFSVFSQNAIEQRLNKVSTNLFSFNRRPVIEPSTGYYAIFMHGLMITHQLSFDHYMRLRFDYFQKNIDHSTGEWKDMNLYSDIQLGAGYVKGFGTYMVKPYLAVDLLFTSALKYSETGGGFTGVYEKIQVHKTGASLSPVLGVTVRANDVLSFSLETNLEMGYALEKGTDFTWTANGIPFEKQVKKNLFFARWNPVGLLSFELSF